jgi:hypothetical protein
VHVVDAAVATGMVSEAAEIGRGVVGVVGAEAFTATVPETM